jgi:nucleoid-associated protein YgaU
MPALAPAPGAPTEEAPAAAKPADKASPGQEQGSGTWVTIPTAGRGRVLDAEERHSPEPPPVREAPTPVATRPEASRRDTDERGQMEVLPHVVVRGENFWTIARLYYGYGRYYKALWAANKDVVPAVDKLYVGQTIRIPPPEALDRSLIEPDRPARPATAAASPTSGSTSDAKAPVRRASRPVPGGSGPESTASGRRAEPGEMEVALPTSDPFARRGGEGVDELDPESNPRYRPRRPHYKVRPYETLRSIARDTLGDSHRADEILDLNEGVIDDPRHLIAGQIIELPEDARVGRRGRGK